MFEDGLKLHIVLHKLQLLECCTQEESNIHFVFQCEHYSAVVIWFINILERFCGIRNPQLMKLSFLDMPKINRKCKNATIMLMSSYIVTMWKARKCNMNSSTTKDYMKSTFLQKKVTTKVSTWRKDGKISYYRSL